MHPADVAPQEEFIERLRAESGRTCGSCSMCCYVLEVDDPELQKGKNTWCQHCRPGKGCSIYNSRPGICRVFACNWLLDGHMPEYWFPQRSKMVVHTETEYGQTKVLVNVDKRFPNRWREQPYINDIRRWAASGLKASRQVAVAVIDGGVNYLIMPDHEFKTQRGDCGVVVPIGLDRYTWVKCKSPEDAEALISAMNEFKAKVRRDPRLASELYKLMDEMISHGRAA